MKKFPFKYIHFKIRSSENEFTLENFIKSIKDNLKCNNTYSLYIKLCFSGYSVFRMCGPQIGIQIKNNYDENYLTSIFNVIDNRISLNLDLYSELFEEINGLQIMFTDINVDFSLKDLKIKFPETKFKSLSNKFQNNILPLTTNNQKYGNYITNTEKISIIEKLKILKFNFDEKDKYQIQTVIKNNFKNKYLIISKVLNFNQYERFIFEYSNLLLIYSCIDTILNDNKFERKIANVKITLENNNIININNEIKLNSISNKIKPILGEINPNIGVLDLETFLDEDGLSKVYAIGYMINDEDKTSKLYYLSDFDNGENMILTFINSILISKYHNFIFYSHNFGNYDFIFIYTILEKFNLEYKMKYGSDFYTLKTFIREDTVIKLEIKIKSPSNKYIKISILDSYNLLNNSLDKLSKDFKLQKPKGKFPYLFVNKNNLEYIGPTPDIKYYINITKTDYQNLYKNTWNLKEETLNYLNLDLNNLLLILIKFSKELYLNFNIELTEGMTISRLALNLFMKKYLKPKTIPLIKKSDIYNFIKFGYYGGITEVYKPYGKDLVYLDVNSLYPFAALKDLPGTETSYLEDFTTEGLKLEELFGFFQADIITNDSYLGLLPVRTKQGLIFPNGKFSGIWSSEELKLAKQYGYTIKINKGYNFNKIPNIFKNYVTDLFEIKKTSSNPLKYITKSLLNNIIGRFALNIFKPINKFINYEKLLYFSSTREIYSNKHINEDKYLVSYSPLISEEICQQHGLDYIKVLEKERPKTLETNFNSYQDISISTTAMINSYARIFMQSIKLNILNNGGTIYYSDTDSLVLDQKGYEIIQSTIGIEIGQFKIEYKVKEAYFISNKTYCLILDNSEYVIKTKGVFNNTLNIDSFKKMYWENTNIKAIKNETIKNYEKGSVNISNKEVNLNHNAYIKRDKLFNSKKEWIDTKPIIYYPSE